MRLLAIDLGHVFRRQWEAGAEEDLGKPLRTTVALVARLREGFDRVAVCCDGGASWRKSILADYKGNRIPAGAPFYEALRRCIERLAADGCHVFTGPIMETGEDMEQRFAEADDVIAALVEWAYDHLEALSTIRIVSGDKDLLALINDGSVDVQRFDMPGEPVWTSADVMAKHGVPPDRVTQWLALGGDLSDNFKAFPGWEERDPKDPNKIVKRPGIGPKTAAVRLAEFGSIEGIFTALESRDVDGNPILTGHIAEVLSRHGREAAKLGMRLATLRSDLPIDFSPLLTEKPVAPIQPKTPFAEPAPSHVPPPAESKTSTAMAVARPDVSSVVGVDPSHAEWALALQPNGPEQAWMMAETLHSSRLFQKKFASAEAIWAVILLGREHGLSALAALQSMYIVDGKVEMDAALIVAKILRSGLAKYFTLIESTDQSATWETHRVGEASPLRMTFTIQEAERRELFCVARDGKRTTFNGKSSNWQKMPDVMCTWRCATKLGRAKYPDVTKGLYGTGEIRETRDVVDAEWEQSA
jgi:5'-3' exonuclease